MPDPTDAAAPVLYPKIKTGIIELKRSVFSNFSKKRSDLSIVISFIKTQAIMKFCDYYISVFVRKMEIINYNINN